MSFTRARRRSLARARVEPNEQTQNTRSRALPLSRSRSLARAHPRASSSLAPSTNPREDSFPSEVTTDTFTHTRTHGTYIDHKNTTRRTHRVPTACPGVYVRTCVRVCFFYVHRCGIHDPYSTSRAPMCARTCVPMTTGARLSARETKRRLTD
jgi:hypothetical protein